MKKTLLMRVLIVASYISYTAHPQYEIEPGARMLNGNGYYTHYTDLINKLRRRAYGLNPEIANGEIDYKLSDYSTMDKLIDLLIREERYERMNEAKHWNFTVRLGKAQELVGAYLNVEGNYTEIKEKHYLWKIPDAEFNYNKAMDQKRDQNPGYTTED